MFVLILTYNIFSMASDKTLSRTHACFLRLYIRSCFSYIHLKHDHPAGWSYFLCFMIQAVGFWNVWPTKRSSLKMDRIWQEITIQFIVWDGPEIPKSSQRDPWRDSYKGTRFLHLLARNKPILEDGSNLASKLARVSTGRGVGGG